jgi:hypothetical protein
MVSAEEFFQQIPKVTKYICGFSFLLTLLSNFKFVNVYSYLLFPDKIFSSDLQVNF